MLKQTSRIIILNNSLSLNVISLGDFKEVYLWNFWKNVEMNIYFKNIDDVRVKLSLKYFRIFLLITFYSFSHKKVVSISPVFESLSSTHFDQINFHC